MTLRPKAGQSRHDIRCVPADTAFVLAASLVLFAWSSKMFFELRLNFLQQNVHFVGLGMFRGQWKELLQGAPEAHLDRGLNRSSALSTERRNRMSSRCGRRALHEPLLRLTLRGSDGAPTFLFAVAVA
jgi:hypothetical protein